MTVSTPGGGPFRKGLPIVGMCLLASLATAPGAAAQGVDGTLEKLIVANGRVVLELDPQQVGAAGRDGRALRLGFEAERDSFTTFMVFNDELRGPLPGSMRILPQEGTVFPASLSASSQQLVVEHAAWGGNHDLVVRDGSTGFLYFNVEGQEYTYTAKGKGLSITGGRLLISEDFAKKLGRPSAANAVAGRITVEASLRAIEVSHVEAGEIREDVLPGLDASLGGVPGPDVIVGDLSSLQQFGTSSGTQVGLAVATDSCNAGVVPLNWFQLPNNDHPVIPQNLYRMSGGASNNDRFEQIGQSSVKHAFTALQQNLCAFGCSPSGTGTLLGVGCSDPYSASLNSGPNLGSRAWINPFTGFYPRGDSATPPNTHTGHTHVGPSHRILTEIADLSTASNPGAQYFAEAQYVTPHEFSWCTSHPGECNMNNNVSYRRFNVSGTTSFTFTAAAATVRMQPAVNAWTGATVVPIEPAPGLDGIGYIAYKVTNPSAGVWHYEYALYNQNLDRAIQSFGFPKGPGVTISNYAFHAPPQHPAWTNDGTSGSAGFSSAPWTQSELNGIVTWKSESFAQNPNANAVRWGTMYNIRFDSNRPPAAMNATLFFLKARGRFVVPIQGPQ